MNSVTFFLTMDSEFFSGSTYEGDSVVMRWDLPQSIQGSFISLRNFSIQCAKKHQPIRVCCNLVLDNWKNPDGCLGDVHHGYGTCSEDMWEMVRGEVRSIVLK